MVLPEQRLRDLIENEEHRLEQMKLAVPDYPMMLALVQDRITAFRQLLNIRRSSTIRGYDIGAPEEEAAA